MKPSVLERLLTETRHRRKMHDLGEFSDPVSLRHPIIPDDGPWVGTLSTGNFIQTRPGTKDPEGVVTAFVKCPIADEDTLLAKVFPTLWKLSEENGWDNRVDTLEKGLQKMQGRGLHPKAVTVPYSSILAITGEDLSQADADKLSLVKGYIAEVGGVRVHSARSALPDNTALITPLPALTGQYVRVLDCVTVLFNRADTVILVRTP